MHKYLVVLCLVACAVAGAAVAQEPADVSMVQLIANPSAFNGKLIRVTGFLRLEFEGNELYLHRDDYVHSVYKNGLWLELSRDESAKNMRLDQDYVTVIGVFDSRDQGHNGLTSGAIVKIQRIELSPRRSR
ncbi:MAG TPA: hypothetical protein VJR26_10595 [Candidatus Acidoferrales bacterium]|nr:hypothetical protein [Candidatus Acidoferrales bacterium]